MPHARNVRTLYKLILRLHRSLPKELHEIGTKYAQEEFKRHRNCNPQEAIIFMQEWSNYAIILAKQLGAKSAESQANFGKNLPVELLDNLRDEQVVQLYELMEAAKAPRSDNSMEGSSS